MGEINMDINKAVIDIETWQRLDDIISAIKTRELAGINPEETEAISKVVYYLFWRP